ncbi:hypothetical protein ADP71_06480 [Vitreoscilla sp. C1]|nr:hypothetical protein ADP71_06480 [Vitreoscilla sp. C1]
MILATMMSINACSQMTAPSSFNTSTHTPPLPTASASTPVAPAHHDDMDDIDEVEILQEHVKLLEQNLFLMQEQMRALQRQQVALNQNMEHVAKNQRIHVKTVDIETHNDLPHDATYSRAYAQYQKKQYAQAIQTLKPYNSGGSGSTDAINGMYLLMLSHKQLKQCESTITIGRQFQQRFPTHIRAAEALYSVGQCQYDMQQKDIARETWKRVRVLYPHSAAARMAAQQLR